MRHRARRPVLDRLRSLATAPRGPAVVVAVLTATTATGAALTAPDGAGSSRTGSSVVGADAPSYASDPTPGSSPSRTPAGPATRERGGRQDAASARESTRTQGHVSRSSDRAKPTADVDPTPSSQPPEPTPSRTGSATTSAPQTTATTRSTRAGRWVIGLSSDTDATFACSLDGGAYQRCGSTVTYDGLDEGRHRFAARATDGDGDTDPSPATLAADIGARGRG